MEPQPTLPAVKTYNYLRIALAALVLLVFASLALEVRTADSCLLPSVSAYWFTPVRAVLVGVLVAMGVCLVALKGNTDGEDVLMNLAGMLAPGVAFIPTVAPGRCGAFASDPGIPDALANNMPPSSSPGWWSASSRWSSRARRRDGCPSAGRTGSGSP